MAYFDKEWQHNVLLSEAHNCNISDKANAPCINRLSKIESKHKKKSLLLISKMVGFKACQYKWNQASSWEGWCVGQMVIPTCSSSSTCPRQHFLQSYMPWCHLSYVQQEKGGDSDRLPSRVISNLHEYRVLKLSTGVCDIAHDMLSCTLPCALHLYTYTQRHRRTSVQTLSLTHSLTHSSTNYHATSDSKSLSLAFFF
jgi:hypothetical protein